MTLKSIFLVCIVVGLAACTTSTPYKAAVGSRDDGYSEQKLESDKYRIVFRGNSSTDRVTVENYVLYRSAEVTLGSGNDYFIMLEDSEEVRRTFQTSGSGFGRGGFGGRRFGGRGFGRRGFFYGGGFGSSFSTTRERTEYTIGAVIQVFSGAKPNEVATAYDARSVIESLGPSIVRPEA